MTEILATQGLSSSTSKSSSGDWRVLILRRLLSEYDQVGTSPGTTAAEQGLELDRSAYWYLGRVVHIYGRVLMVWRLSAEDAPGVSGTVSPFDSGGLWHGHIAVDPPFALDAEAVKYVKEWTTDVAAGSAMFKEWIADAFVNPFEYVAGLGPPIWQMCSRLDQDNEFSWSWELRHRKEFDVDPEVLLIDTIFWSQDDYQNFRSFLRHGIADPSLYRALVQQLVQISHVSQGLNAARQQARNSIAARMS